MKKDIVCTVCDIVLGSLEKEVITDQDVSNYQAMVACSNGHNGASISLEDPE